MNDAFGKFIGILTGILGLAIVAVVLSKNSNTSSVMQSFFTGFGGLVQAAVSPVTGGSSSALSGVANSLGSIGGIGNGLIGGNFG